MKTFTNNGILIENLSELPNIPFKVKRLFFDWETSSGNPKFFSTNPWHHCNALGAAVTWDDNPHAYYIPARLEPWDFLQLLLNRTECWINHNITYDMNVTANCTPVIIPDIRIICTLTSAKLIDSDRMSYALDALSKDWLKLDISSYENAFKLYLRHPGGSLKNRDYGAIPEDIMAEYACQDVVTNRKLHHHIESNLPTECKRVYEMEQEITSILFNMEQHGMPIDLELLAKDFVQIPDKLYRMEEELHNETGKIFRPHVGADLYDILHVHYGLPVVEFTDTGNPGFGKRALAIYKKYDKAPKKVIAKIEEYKKLHKVWTSFVKSYVQLHTTHSINNKDWRIHPSVNQCIRTGRMSMKEPNLQQLPEQVKHYIVPRPGHSIVSNDLSQIEYRLISDYCGDEKTIRAYTENPETDYHQWVADNTGLDRRPAKTVNFLSGYGGGVNRLAEQLQEDETFCPSFDNFADFFRHSRIAAKQFLSMYHANLPNLKKTMRDASNTLKARGYLKNKFGRHRHMPTKVFSKKHNRTFDVSYRAFNNASQSSAADLFKDRTVAISKYIKENNLPIQLIGLVHDDWVLHMPTELVEIEMPRIQKIINTLPEGISMSIPIRCDYKHSNKSWGDC